MNVNFIWKFIHIHFIWKWIWSEYEKNIRVNMMWNVKRIFSEHELMKNSFKIMKMN